MSNRLVYSVGILVGLSESVEVSPEPFDPCHAVCGYAMDRE
ncbi:MAG: hypothetical protein ACK5SP_02265 [bacterium]